MSLRGAFIFSKKMLFNHAVKEGSSGDGKVANVSALQKLITIFHLRKTLLRHMEIRKKQIVTKISFLRMRTLIILNIRQVSNKNVWVKMQISWFCRFPG